MASDYIEERKGTFNYERYLNFPPGEVTLFLNYRTISHLSVINAIL